MDNMYYLIFEPTYTFRITSYDLCETAEWDGVNLTENLQLTLDCEEYWLGTLLLF